MGESLCRVEKSEERDDLGLVDEVDLDVVGSVTFVVGGPEGVVGDVGRDLRAKAVDLEKRISSRSSTLVVVVVDSGVVDVGGSVVVDGATVVVVDVVVAGLER